MRRISFAIALTILLLASKSIAQQATNHASTASERTVSPPTGPILGGMGTVNYIPIWAAPSFLVDSAIYQASAGNIGVGTTSPVAKLDVNGSVNSAAVYQIEGNGVLGIGRSSDSNLFVGVGAGFSNVAGFGVQNTFSGFWAGYNNTTAYDNTFFGYEAGYRNSTGYDNTFSGAAAGSNNATGYDNTFFGAEAGTNNSIGSGNTFYGESSGYSNTAGLGNTFTGSLSGDLNTTAQYNSFYGAGAGQHLTNGNNNIYIANLGCPYPCGEDSTIRIGGDTGSGYGPQVATYIAGIYGASVGSQGFGVVVSPSGQLGTMVSSRRFKEQIRDLDDSSRAWLKLRPVTFLYRPEYDKGPRTLQYGLIAEEVAELYPELVANDAEGNPITVRYQFLPILLLDEVQKQYRRAESEAKLVATQQSEIRALQEQNREFQERLSRLEKLVPQTVARK